MFDIAWSEFLIVAVVALVVVGPRDLPALLRQVGRMVSTVRKMAGDFQTQFNDALKEAELDDLRREVTGLKDIAGKAAKGNPFTIAGEELRKAMEPRAADTPSALAGDTPAPTHPDADPAPSALAPEPSTPTPVSAGDHAVSSPVAYVPEQSISTADPSSAATTPVVGAPSDAPPPPSDVESASEPKPGAAS